MWLGLVARGIDQAVRASHLIGIANVRAKTGGGGRARELARMGHLVTLRIVSTGAITVAHAFDAHMQSQVAAVCPRGLAVGVGRAAIIGGRFGLTGSHRKDIVGGGIDRPGPEKVDTTASAREQRKRQHDS